MTAQLSHRAQQGFTLLEMLVVIVIIAVGFSVLAYGISKGLDNTRDRQARMDLAMTLRSVRSQAIFSGKTVLLQVDLSRNAYRVPGQAQHLLPEGMRMRLTTAANLSPQQGTIAFYPNGSSSGANILLEKGVHTSRIDIAWLTGKVSWTDAVQP